jgi:hypothetical protein
LCERAARSGEKEHAAGEKMVLRSSPAVNHFIFVL